MRLRHFQAGDEDRWDDFVAESRNGTILHSRRFLNYHGMRFQDRSLLIYDDADKLVGVFPAAHDAVRDDRVVSHPGAPFGGLIHCGELVGPAAVEALQAIAAFYAGFGYRTLEYRTTPWIYHQVPTEDDRYALFRMKAARWRTDLCACIFSGDRLPLSRNRRAGLRRAAQAGVMLDEGHRYLPDVWDILEPQLATRFDARPTHTLAEIQDLADRLDGALRCRVALLDRSVVAGIVLFALPPVLRAQYSAANAIAREISALDLLFDTTIREGADSGLRYVDFGNSNTENGWVLNDGLYRFKLGFGAGSIAHDVYELPL